MGNRDIETMKITITIKGTDDGQVNVAEARVASDGETEESVTSATALADAMFEVMDQLGEVEGCGPYLFPDRTVSLV